MTINGPAHGAVSRSYLVSCPGVAQKKWFLVVNGCFFRCVTHVSCRRKKTYGPKFHQLKFFHTIPMTLWRPFITPSMARLVYGYQLMNINHYEWTITMNGQSLLMVTHILWTLYHGYQPMDSMSGRSNMFPLRLC